jgi:hypothetical protein
MGWAEERGGEDKGTSEAKGLPVSPRPALHTIIQTGVGRHLKCSYRCFHRMRSYPSYMVTLPYLFPKHPGLNSFCPKAVRSPGSAVS